MLHQAATVFSWGLTIGGVLFTTFGDISVSHSLSGYGTSGVVTSTMTVSTYNAPAVSEAITINAPVVLTCSATSINPPKYFVTSRKIEGNITVWTCADMMSRTELSLDLSDDDFTNEKISCNDLFSKIKSKCGFSAVGSIVDYSVVSKIGSIDESICKGYAVRSILETISAALVGYWIVGDDDELIFVPFGQYYRGVQVTQYTKLVPCGTKSISRIIMVNGDDMYTAGTGSAYQTVTVDAELATAELAASAVSNMLGNKTAFNYEAYKCDKGISLGWVYLGAIVFGSGDTAVTKLCSNVTMYPSPSGLFFTASCNAVQEDEASYLTETQRRLMRCIELDRERGNASLGNEGLYLFENGYKTTQKSDPNKKVKYGFTVSKDGITEYEGAMTSMVIPTAGAANDDLTEVTIGYDCGKKYKYNITYDNSGNITNMVKTEVTDT